MKAAANIVSIQTLPARQSIRKAVFGWLHQGERVEPLQVGLLIKSI